VPLDDEYPSARERERRAAEALAVVRAALREPVGGQELRLGELVSLLVATDPERKAQRKAWSARGEQVAALRRAVRRYVDALKNVPQIRNALCAFSDADSAARLIEALDAELEWREQVERQDRALPPDTTTLWWPFREGGRPGRPLTRRRVAEKAIAFGLEPEHIAMLESCLRVPLPEWPLHGELPPAETLYLTPRTRRPKGDVLRDERILGRWRKVFSAARVSAPREPALSKRSGGSRR
jgi:hypothetical protein